MMEPGDIVASMHKPINIKPGKIAHGGAPPEPSYSELERVNKVLLSRCDFLEKRLLLAAFIAGMSIILNAGFIYNAFFG